MSEEFARQLMTWQYDESYAMYNIDSESLEEAVSFFVDPSNHYFSVTDDQGDLIAFRCFGDDAQVPGGDYSEEALDTGGGLRPDLTGRGLGLSILQAGLAFGERMFRPNAFRVTVATFNTRALKVCKRAAFEETQRFRRASDGLEFSVLVHQT